MTSRNATREDDDLSDDEFDSMREWPNRVEAAKMAGCTTRTIDYRARRGDIRSVVVDGVKRYDPAFLAPEESDSEAKNETIKTLNDTVKVLSEKMTAFANLTLEPARLMLEVFQRENEAVRKQRDSAVDQLNESIDTMREVLLAKEERELARAQYLASEDRKAAAMKLVMQVFPTIVDQLTSGSEVSRLVKGLKADDIEAMKETGILSESQYSAVLRIRGEARANNGPGETTKSETSSDVEKEVN